jgi:hypothetical protein
MRAIISAIIHALRSAFGAIAAMLSAPYRFLFSARGGMPSIDIPEVAPATVTPPQLAVDHTDRYAKVAEAMMSWAAESILADERQPVPQAWPRSIKNWAQGLDREELFAIIDGPKHAVTGHISEVFAMPRVRKVQPLPATPWEKSTPISSGGFVSRGFAVIAADAEPH